MVNFKNFQRDILKSLLLLGPLLALFITIGLYREEREESIEIEQNNITQIQSQIHKLNQDVAYLKENGKIYEKLVNQGWFRPLDRMEAAHIIEAIASETNLNEVSYNLMTLEPSKRPMGTNGNVVELSFSGVLDSHVFEFIEQLEQKLPGHIVPESLSLTRYEGITPQNLEALRNFNRPNFVSGEYSFHWLVDEQAEVSAN